MTAYKGAVNEIVACAICGGDPATDTMLVNAAIAGVMSMPFIFRDRLSVTVRHILGRREEEPAASCQLSTDEDDPPIGV